MQWNYYEPVFECDKLNYELLTYAPWSGHRNFLYDFLAFFKVEKIVELGSHYGCSAFTFCQADKDLNLNMSMYFVDTWQGDDFTKKYNNDVFSVFKNTLNQIYSSQNAYMIRMTFDEAVNKYEDNFFDILHIDGSHYYNDVKHDFETWKSKVKTDGIILFHDISSDKVYGELMGSHLFWQEIKKEYKYTFEFDFSFGLGVLFLSEDKYKSFINAFDPTKYQRINNNLAVEYKDELRKDYFKMVDFKVHIDSLYKQIEIKDEHLNSYARNVEEKDSYIKQLEQDKTKSEEIYTRYEETIKGKDNYINELEKAKEESEEVYARYEETIKGKDNYISELEKAKEESEEVYARYEETIKGKDNYINELEKAKEESEEVYTRYEETIKGKDNYINELEKAKEESEEVYTRYEETIKGKDNYISELEKAKEESEEVYTRYEETIKGKDNYISELEKAKEESEKTYKSYEETIKGKDNYISELEKAKDESEETIKYSETKIEELERELNKCLSYKIKKLLFKKK